MLLFDIVVGYEYVARMSMFVLVRRVVDIGEMFVKEKDRLFGESGKLKWLLFRLCW